MSNFGYLYDWEDEDPGIAIDPPFCGGFYGVLFQLVIIAILTIGWFAA